MIHIHKDWDMDAVGEALESIRYSTYHITEYRHPTPESKQRSLQRLAVPEQILREIRDELKRRKATQ